jgi:hypothetical protein
MRRRNRKRRRRKGRRKRKLRAKRRAITVLLMFLRTSKRWRILVIPVPADEPPESRRCKTRMRSPVLDLPAVTCIYSVLQRISPFLYIYDFGFTPEYNPGRIK